MTYLQFFTATCGLIWAITAFLAARRKGTAFDSGKKIEEEFELAKQQLPRPALVIVYVYLLWFRGFVPHAVEHNGFDYYCLVIGAIVALDFCRGFLHLVAWLRLELKGMGWAYGSGGPDGGLFRVSQQLTSGEMLLDPLSREQRKSTEISYALKRRTEFQRSTLAVVGAGLCTFLGSVYAPWVGWIAGLVLLGPALAWWLPTLVEVVAYNAGAQYIPGAKVLDPEVQSRGLDDVRNEMAHGDARVATEKEALALLDL